MRFARSALPCLLMMTSATLAYGQYDSEYDEPPKEKNATGIVESNGPGKARLRSGEPRPAPMPPITAYFDPESDDSVLPPPPFDFGDFHVVPAHEVAPGPWMCALPVRVIGQPMPAPIAEPFAFGHPPVPAPVHPDEIQSHLSAAAAQLAAAGLTTEAEKIVAFQQQLDRDHSQQLLIVFKEAQVRALQAEIEFLRRAQQHVAKAPATRSLRSTPPPEISGSTVLEAKTLTYQPLR